MPNTGSGTGPGNSPSEQKKDCKWKDCQKDHSKAISYSDQGKISRSSNYADQWKTLEPWKQLGGGLTGTRATLQDYRKETPSAKYAVNASKMTGEEYHTQKHHLISVNLFSNVKKLSHNAKLINYDLNHKNNGSCFPSYAYDIFRHDLQCHRGSHPKATYNDHIAPLLRDREKKCITFCQKDTSCDTSPQQMLMQKLNGLSAICYSQIRTWKWFLRSKAKAIQERKDSFINQGIQSP